MFQKFRAKKIQVETIYLIRSGLPYYNISICDQSLILIQEINEDLNGSNHSFASCSI